MDHFRTRILRYLSIHLSICLSIYLSIYLCMSIKTRILIYEFNLYVYACMPVVSIGFYIRVRSDVGFGISRLLSHIAEA